MSLNMSIRIIIKIFLTIQLLLLIFRQLIDFAGIQWLMIIVNAIAIIITITAFFGHLFLYGSFQVLLIVYNVFVICIYGRLITVSDQWMADNGSIATIASAHHHIEDFGVGGYRPDQLDGSIARSPHTITTATDDTSAHTILPSTQLLSFDLNSRSFWYVIVSNHVSNLRAHILTTPAGQDSSPVADVTGNSMSSSSPTIRHHHHHHHQPSLVDESLVDLCVQYIEIAIASLHIFFSLLGIGLILLKYKLQRDKLSRNNDKTTPPLPPYTISPQMNHYMSYTPTSNPTHGLGHSLKNSIYSSTNNGSLRRSKRRRSTRSLHNSKAKKANSMGNLALRSSTGSLRSISKHNHHRKSVTSLLMNNGTGADNTFSTNTTIGSRGGGGGGTRGSQRNSLYQSMSPGGNSSVYGVYQSRPPPQQQSTNARHSVYLMGGSTSSQQHAAKLLNSDSETDYYHTFTPSSYVNNGLTNPLYGNRNSYLNDSETAI